MTQTVLDVGNCDADHGMLQRMLDTHYDVHLLWAHTLQDALDAVAKNKIDLVLVNRKLDVDYSEGTEVIKALKAKEETREIPVMLVTNFPEHQELAVSLGAEPGFGKLQYKLPATHERLSRFLTPK